MSRNGEFDHGSEHRFAVKRVAPGYYTTCCGHDIEIGANREYEGSDSRRWFVQHPNKDLTEHASLKDATEYLRSNHT